MNMFKLFKKKEKTEKPKTNPPLYVYKPYNDRLLYRVEKRDDIYNVYLGWDRTPTYRVEDGKIYRYSAEKPSYIIIGKRIYKPDGETLCYVLRKDGMYFHDDPRPILIFRDSLIVQGTL